MNNNNPEFWKIIQTQFPEHADDQLRDFQPRQHPLPGLEQDDDEVWVRDQAFERDEVVADYFSGNLDISEEAFIAYLQENYPWTKEQAKRAAYGDNRQFSEEVGHDDEA